MTQKKSEAKNRTGELSYADILGVRVAIADEDRVLTRIRNRIQDKENNGSIRRPLFVVTVNPEFAVQAHEDDEFRKVLNSADLAVADGAGLRLADSRLLVVPGRRLVERLASSGYRVFFLGGRQEVAREMANKYGGEYDPGTPDIKSEILNPKPETSSNDRIIRKINGFRPEVLLVAYGAPWQEKWIAANLHRLQAKVVIGVGGAFDYLTGRAKLPPEWMAQRGLEWLWRLLLEPWRWRRQLRLIKFVWLVRNSKI